MKLIPSKNKPIWTIRTRCGGAPLVGAPHLDVEVEVQLPEHRIHAPWRKRRGSCRHLFGWMLEKVIGLLADSG